MSADSKWFPRHFRVVLLLSVAVFIAYVDRTNISVGAIPMQAQFGWSETQKGLVLAAFFVGYILMMIASGALASRFGGRLVLGGALLWWSLFTVLTPLAAEISLPTLIAARIALGLGESAVFPASMNIIGRFVPPMYRSRAVAFTCGALHIGTVVALPVTGWLVHKVGWPLPFYLFGVLGLLWAAAVLMRLDDSPAGGVAAPATRTAIPWGALLRLPCVWAIVVAHFCSNWPLYVMIAWLPTYFSRTFGVSLVNAGLLSAAPPLASFVMSNVGGYVADSLLAKGHSATFVRKLLQVSGLLCGAISLLLLAQATSLGAALVFACCASGTYAITIAGFGPNGLDIAPKHADIIWGLSNTVATLPGIFGVALTGWLVDRTGSFATPFLVTTAVSIAGSLFYLVFCSGERHVE